VEAAQAQRFLSEHFGRDVYGLTRFTSGEWSKAYAFTLGEQ